jgi:TIGR03009 family protein
VTAAPPGTSPGTAPGQPGAPPAAPPAAPAPADKVLDGYLLRWEQEMQKIQTLGAQLERVEIDRTLETKQTFSGYAYYMKSGTGPTALNMAMLKMWPKGKTENDFSEKFVCTGTYLYQFNPAEKEIKAYELPKPKAGQVADDNFLSFLFGMKAEQARQRYDMQLEKEDQYYIYVKILPRTPADKADFKQAQIVLAKDSFLPAQLWFEQVNNSEVTWKVPAIRSGVQLDRKLFDAPTPPTKEWKIVPGVRPTEAQPKVIRSGQ